MRQDEAMWQRMDSAPRDGTRILVTVRASEQGDATVDTAYWEATRTRESGWRAGDSSADCVIAYQQAELMGWMPLPAPGSPMRPRPMRLDESDGSGI